MNTVILIIFIALPICFGIYLIQLLEEAYPSLKPKNWSK